MLAISIKQPWAWLIVNGYKDIENRDWPTNRRGMHHIHTGKKPDPDFDYARWEAYIGRHIPRDLPLGALVGEARITDCVVQHESKWFFGDFGFVLDSQRAYPHPIPCKGQLGFFDPQLPEGAFFS